MKNKGLLIKSLLLVALLLTNYANANIVVNEKSKTEANVETKNLETSGDLNTIDKVKEIRKKMFYTIPIPVEKTKSFEKPDYSVKLYKKFSDKACIGICE